MVGAHSWVTFGGVDTMTAAATPAADAAVVSGTAAAATAIVVQLHLQFQAKLAVETKQRRD